MQQRPNIILIVADDLGYGDVGCYGNTVNATPHIDALANGGLKFTDFHSNGPVCSPTRAAMLTGRYQQRVGIESALGEDEQGLSSRELTVATCLQNAGYSTGMFGKWHLGMSLEEGPNRHGFQQFIGHRHGALDYQSHVTKYGAVDWWHNEKLCNEEGYCTELITDHAVQFIKEQHTRPFFLYVPHSAIHFPWMAPEDPAHRQAGVRYADLSRLGPHPPGEVGGVVKKMIKSLDDSVGRIMGTVRDLGLERETFVLFTSDNGGIREYAGGFDEISSNGPFRDGKGSIYEGGHRVPAIAYWPDTIAPARTTEETTMTMDLFPTCLSLAGVDAPEDLHLDGVDLRSVMLEEMPLSERSLFWRLRRKRAVRKGEWKLCAQGSERELYNLSEDRSETEDLSHANPKILEALEADLLHWEQEVGR
jgi:arylsulfatase A